MRLAVARHRSDDAFGSVVLRLPWRDGRDSETGPDVWTGAAYACVPDDPAGGSPACVAPSTQDAPSIAVTGFAPSFPNPPIWPATHGVIVAWQDDRNGDWDISARRTEGAVRTDSGDEARRLVLIN